MVMQQTNTAQTTSVTPTPSVPSTNSAKLQNKGAQSGSLFRKEALEQTASPERLDQLVQIVSPKRWLSLTALGALVAIGSAWSIFGQIPITVTGRGVLVYPSKVVTAQAPSSGRLLALNVQPGDSVKKGEVLATIDQSELQNQLQLARNKLVQLRQQDEAASMVQGQRDNLDQSTTAQQRQALQQNLQIVQSLTPVLREKGLDSIQRERQALQQRLQTLRGLLPTYQQRWQARQEAHEQGALSKDNVLQAQQEYVSAQAQLNEVEAQLKQLDVKEATAQREYLSNLNQINELQTQISALDSRAATQVEQNLAAITNRKKEIQETERTIAQLELQLQRNSQIVSDYDGQVVEIAVQPGQRIEPGMGIGTIAAQSNTDELVGIVFLPVSEGKKIQKDMTVQVTPTTVKREEYGGIVGKVTQISEFPVTQQGAASLVGNPDILPEVLSEGAYLAVYTDLETLPSQSSTANSTQVDSKQKYRWSSSKGPDQAITAGTTTSARITVEEKTPISYVIPILKSWAGLD